MVHALSVSSSTVTVVVVYTAASHYKARAAKVRGLGRGRYKRVVSLSGRQKSATGNPAMAWRPQPAKTLPEEMYFASLPAPLASSLAVRRPRPPIQAVPSDRLNAGNRSTMSLFFLFRLESFLFLLVFLEII